MIYQINKSQMNESQKSHFLSKSYALIVYRFQYYINSHKNLIKTQTKIVWIIWGWHLRRPNNLSTCLLNYQGLFSSLIKWIEKRCFFGRINQTIYIRVGCVQSILGVVVKIGILKFEFNCGLFSNNSMIFWYYYLFLENWSQEFNLQFLRNL